MIKNVPLFFSVPVAPSARRSYFPLLSSFSGRIFRPLPAPVVSDSEMIPLISFQSAIFSICDLFNLRSFCPPGFSAFSGRLCFRTLFHGAVLSVFLRYLSFSRLRFSLRFCFSFVRFFAVPPSLRRLRPTPGSDIASLPAPYGAQTVQCRQYIYSYSIPGFCKNYSAFCPGLTKAERLIQRFFTTTPPVL